jgi:hypothetical protein
MKGGDRCHELDALLVYEICSLKLEFIMENVTVYECGRVAAWRKTLSTQ